MAKRNATPATPTLADLTQALAALSAQVSALAQNNAPAPAKKSPRKAKAKAKAITGTFGTDANYAVGLVSDASDITRENYALVLAAARKAGHPWLDGSDKPIVHMLKAAGITWAGKAQREQAIAQAKQRMGGK